MQPADVKRVGIIGAGRIGQAMAVMWPDVPQAVKGLGWE